MILRRLLRCLRPYWWGSLVSIVLVLVLSVFRLGPAWFVKLIVDNALPTGDLGPGRDLHRRHGAAWRC